jgi:hypothetical protein
MKNTERIIKSNKSCIELEKHGYSCQGVTNKMTQIAVSKEGKIYHFKDYIEAFEELITKKL